ncbi:MAG: hypothetical protein HQM03_12955 [Magnetococcales bacterium]|nr:hypothetical protein [Magnetococcales bacterium]
MIINRTDCGVVVSLRDQDHMVEFLGVKELLAQENPSNIVFCMNKLDISKDWVSGVLTDIAVAAREKGVGVKLIHCKDQIRHASADWSHLFDLVGDDTIKPCEECVIDGDGCRRIVRPNASLMIIAS